jgi:predicted nuclease of predicted toxin-antitoxin system
MKFLTDVNASGSVAKWLLEMGHDVAQVINVDSRMSDDAILSWALAEQRIIVTTDKDFEEMVWREAKPHNGLLRLENLPRSRRQILLEYVLAHHGQDLEEGAVVIALETKTRVRRPSHR